MRAKNQIHAAETARIHIDIQPKTDRKITMASYAYCHHISEKKHINVPSKTSTSVNDLGAPEDGNQLNQIPKKKNYKNCHFHKDFGYDEAYDVIKGPYEEGNKVSDVRNEKNTQLKYATRMQFEMKNASMLGGIYRPGKELPKPYKVGKKPFNKFDYLHSNGTGCDAEHIRFLKRQNIKVPNDAAGLKSTQFQKVKEAKDEPNRRFPDKWWEIKDKNLLIHKVAQHQRWFDSPLVDDKTTDSEKRGEMQGINNAEKELMPPDTKNLLLDENNCVDESFKIKQSIKNIVRQEVKETGRGLGMYTHKLRHTRENPIYHVQNLPGFKPGIHTVDDPANAHSNKDVMRTYPAESMQIHHLKPTTGMLAWT